MEKELTKKVTDDLVAKATAELQANRNLRVKEAIIRIKAVCEELDVIQVPQFFIEGNQVDSQIVVVSKI